VGLAADPDAVCVHTMLPAYEADAVRVGQSARVKIDGTSVEIAATIREIGSSPIESGGRSSYPMTLAAVKPFGAHNEQGAGACVLGSAVVSITALLGVLRVGLRSDCAYSGNR
jgi:hypothetical protein